MEMQRQRRGNNLLAGGTTQMLIGFRYAVVTVSIASAHGIDIFQISQSAPQSTYRGREEIGRVYLPSWNVHYNFVRDGRYSERG